MIVYSAPASFNMPALISPVNAPSFSQWTSCPEMPIGEFRAASTAAWSAVNGGATTISTSLTSLTMLRNSLMNTTASCTVLCIFQFAAMKGVLMRSPQGCDSGQRPSAEELERRATAGRDVRDPVGDTRLRDRRDRVAPADYRRSPDVRHGPGDLDGT